MKTIYIARVSDGNSDACRASFDRAEASNFAREYKAHLTALELKTHRVTLEAYTVECPADDVRDAETLWRDIEIESVWRPDADEYEEV